MKTRNTKQIVGIEAKARAVAKIFQGKAELDFERLREEGRITDAQANELRRILESSISSTLRKRFGDSRRREGGRS